VSTALFRHPFPAFFPSSFFFLKGVGVEVLIYVPDSMLDHCIFLFAVDSVEHGVRPDDDDTNVEVECRQLTSAAALWYSWHLCQPLGHHAGHWRLQH
jgi:hypothetical protein